MGLQFVTSLLLARIFGEAGFGQWGIILACSQWGYSLFLGWTNAALTRYGREEMLQTGRLNRTFTVRLKTVIPGLLIMFLIAVTGAPWIGAWMGAPAAATVLVVAYTLAFATSETAYYVLPAVGRSDLISALNALERSLTLGIIAILYTAGRADPVTVLAGFILPPLMVGLPTLWRLRHRIGPWEPDPELQERFWNFCRPVLFITPLIGLLGWGDLFVIRYFATLQDVGHYFLVFQFYNAITQLSVIVTTVFTPFAVLIVVRERRDLAELLVNRAQNLSLIFACSAAFALTIIADVIFFFIGGAHAVSMSRTWLLLLPGGIMTFLCATLSSVYMAKEATRAVAGIAVSMMAVNFTFDILLVPYIGNYGAACGVTAGMIVAYVGYMRGLRAFGMKNRGTAARFACSFLPSLLLAASAPLPTGLRAGLSVVISLVLAAYGIRIGLDLMQYRHTLKEI